MAPLGLAIAVGHFKSVIKAKTSSSFLWAWHFTASLIGFITLFCVAVRNGLLLVDNFNWRHQNGEAPMELIRNGSLERLNAIVDDGTDVIPWHGAVGPCFWRRQ